MAVFSIEGNWTQTSYSMNNGNSCPLPSGLTGTVPPWVCDNSLGTDVSSLCDFANTSPINNWLKRLFNQQFDMLLGLHQLYLRLID